MTISKSNEDVIYNIHTFDIDEKNRELYLHPYIESSSEADEEYGSYVDFRCAVSFTKNLRYLDLLNQEPILIHMHLPGGNWVDCMGIYDSMKSCKSKLIVLGYSQVESASSVIFQAADYRVLMPNTYVLIHYGSYGAPASDHPKIVMNSVQWNEKESEKMIDIYTEKFMRSPMNKEKQWKKLIAKKHIQSQLTSKGDWILTPQEAVYYGFADGIFGDKKFQNIDHIKKLK